MKKNYWLDWLLFLSGLVCISTGILLDFHLIPGGREAKGPFVMVHRYSGYIMAVGILLHLVWHKSWISAMTKKVFGKQRICPKGVYASLPKNPRRANPPRNSTKTRKIQ